jgi:hypothetical protein
MLGGHLALGGYTAATLLDAPKHTPLSVCLQCARSGSAVTLAKAPGESVEHLVLKGLLWALLLPAHPDAACEVDLGLRYKPDVVALDHASGLPRWWGECGSVKPSKLQHLATSFPDCRFTVAKWGRSDLTGYAYQLVRRALTRTPLKEPLPSPCLAPTLPSRAQRSGVRLPHRRTAPFELVSFPADSIERFISDEGHVTVDFEDLQVISLLDAQKRRR